ncbi:hypothetical protein LBWT_X0480 (plasmid) [Leptolyngbya boryana IAM M-101]|nr:hypothetical protein LBWT_X0480 [Leptolyngbya boryana IAM M-101]BAS66324.1 hypothetical protein LBDG_X0480 [Leptolyngbya boryana dg5]
MSFVLILKTHLLSDLRSSMKKCKEDFKAIPKAFYLTPLVELLWKRL